DDAVTPEPPTARRAFFPSSMGLSLLLPAKAKEVTVTVRWGDYQPSAPAAAAAPALPPKPATIFDEEAGNEAQPARTPQAWKRTDRREFVSLSLRAPATLQKQAARNGTALRTAAPVPPVLEAASSGGLAQKETRSVWVFLINRRTIKDADTP